jgi:DNA polymerase-3 subunit epsilon/CBS domain-containing protein
LLPISDLLSPLTRRLCRAEAVVADRLSATPLLALDAVALDTETTSLDPVRARLVELGAVRLIAGRVESADRFHALVDPGEPIPSSSTRIHGIDANRLAGAPDFTKAWPGFRNFIGDGAVIGHTIDYDLAVIAGEAKRANIDYRAPRAIDIRVLAEFAKPSLPGFSIEQLAAWLDVQVENRHSALGDAVTTARIFAALVPLLRERGVRTFAEAEAVCRKFAAAMAQRGGQFEPSVAGVESERALERLDSYPYRHRVRDVMSKPPIFVAENVPLSAAMDMLMQRRVSSLFVSRSGGNAEAEPPLASETGILTERDVLRAIAKGGSAVLARPLDEYVSKPLAAVPAEAFVYRAIGRMSRLKIRHLGVIDESGRVVGALSARDLLRLRAGEAVSLGDEIDAAADVHELARAWAKMPAVARSLVAEGVDARDIAAVISRELGALTRRAAMLGESRMRAAGQGGPPVAYAVLVLGSGGRGESLLAMDQDNAIVFAEGEPDGANDRWFADLGTHIADILHEVGVPYCQGGVMAKNAAWRGSAAVWRARIAEWVTRSNPQDLLSVDIFFDFRSVHGDGALAESLWRDAFDLARNQVAFLKLLAEAAGPFEPPVGFFGIKTDNGRVDLKRGGLFGIVATARVLALRFHVAARSTRARLEGTKAMKVGAERDLDALIESHGVLLGAVLSQQLVDIAAGRPPSNKVEARRLGRTELEKLKQALKSLKNADVMVRDLLTAR